MQMVCEVKQMLYLVGIILGLGEITVTISPIPLQIHSPLKIVQEFVCTSLVYLVYFLSCEHFLLSKNSVWKITSFSHTISDLSLTIKRGFNDALSSLFSSPHNDEGGN